MKQFLSKKTLRQAEVMQKDDHYGSIAYITGTIKAQGL